VIIAYDDSGDWYDHVMPPLVSTSSDPVFDALFGQQGLCGNTQHTAAVYQDRCGYGPRLILLAIFTFSKTNYIDHHITNQTSILRFIEDNWLDDGQRIEDHSLDAKVGSIASIFDFNCGDKPVNSFFLDSSTGMPAK
jgi:phospholipase C